MFYTRRSQPVQHAATSTCWKKTGLTYRNPTTCQLPGTSNDHRGHGAAHFSQSHLDHARIPSVPNFSCVRPVLFNRYIARGALPPLSRGRMRPPIRALLSAVATRHALLWSPGCAPGFFIRPWFGTNPHISTAPNIEHISITLCFPLLLSFLPCFCFMGFMADSLCHHGFFRYKDNTLNV